MQTLAIASIRVPCYIHIHTTQYTSLPTSTCIIMQTLAIASMLRVPIAIPKCTAVDSEDSHVSDGVHGCVNVFMTWSAACGQKHSQNTSYRLLEQT